MAALVGEQLEIGRLKQILEKERKDYHESMERELKLRLKEEKNIMEIGRLKQILEKERKDYHESMERELKLRLKEEKNIMENENAITLEMLKNELQEDVRKKWERMNKTLAAALEIVEENLTKYVECDKKLGKLEEEMARSKSRSRSRSISRSRSRSRSRRGSKIILIKRESAPTQEAQERKKGGRRKTKKKNTKLKYTKNKTTRRKRKKRRR